MKESRDISSVLPLHIQRSIWAMANKWSIRRMLSLIFLTLIVKFTAFCACILLVKDCLVDFL